MKKKVKYEIHWWDDYYNADYFERKKMIETLPIIKEVTNESLPPKLRIYCIVNLINSYFEDLIDYMNTRKINEKKEAKE